PAAAPRSEGDRSPASFVWMLFPPLLLALLAAAGFAAYARSLDAGSEWFEQTAVVAGLVFGATLLTTWSARHACRRVFRDLGRHAAELREKPSSPQPSLRSQGRALGATELAGPLQALADCYRQALERVIEVKEALAVLQSNLNKGRHGTEPRPDLRRY